MNALGEEQDGTVIRQVGEIRSVEPGKIALASPLDVADDERLARQGVCGEDLPVA